MSNKEKLDQGYLSDNQINTFESENFKEIIQTEINKRKELEFQLKERRKELHCQNEISRILINRVLSTDDKIEKMMFAVKSALQFSEITEVCLTINGKSIKTSNYTHSKYNLVHNLFDGEKSYGEIKVCYLEDSFYGDENHVFLNEEYELIFSVGVRIINYLKMLEEKQKANKSLQFYNSFMTSSPDALIITNLRAIIEYVSPATLKLFGYNRNDDLVGKSILDFIDKADQGFVIYEIEKMFEGIFCGSYDYRAVKNDGTLRWIGVNCDFIKDSEGQNEKMIFVLRDIENRKKTELALQKSEEMYRSLVESSDAAIMMLNPAGEYIYLNLKEAQRFGLKPEDFKGKGISDFFPIEQVTQMLADIQKVVFKNKGFSREMPVHFKGIDSFYRINIQPVRNVYQVPFAALFYITDITQVKQGEEKIRISEERFRNLIESINNVLITIDIDSKLAVGNGILTDITQQKLAEEKFLKCEERFRNLVETINEVVSEKLFRPFDRIEADKTSIEETGLGLTISKKLM